MNAQIALDFDAPRMDSLPGGLSLQWAEGFHAGRVRAFHGYAQFRECRGDRWRFAVSGFDGTYTGQAGRCSLIRADGGTDYDVRIDARDRIQIAGRWYGRDHWDH